MSQAPRVDIITALSCMTFVAYFGMIKFYVNTAVQSNGRFRSHVVNHVCDRTLTSDNTLISIACI